MAGIKTSQLGFITQPAAGSTVELQLALPGGGYESKRILISDLRGAVAAAFATLAGQPADNAALSAVFTSFQDQINALSLSAGIGFSTAATTANRLSQTLTRATITVVGTDAWLYVGGAVTTPANWINLSASPFPAFPASPAGKVLKIAPDGVTLIWAVDETGSAQDLSVKVDIAGGIIDTTQYTPATPAFWIGLVNGGGKVEAKVAFDYLQSRISAIPAPGGQIATDAEYLASNAAKAATPDQVNRLGETRITITPTTPTDATGLVLTAGKATVRVFADWVVGRLKDIATSVAAKFTLPSGGTLSQYITGTGTLATFPETAALTENAYQPFHGFVVGNVLRNVGGLWGKARANTTAASRNVGVVSAVTDGDNFVITLSGKVNTGTMSLAAATLYYLSSATAGLLTATKPTGAGVIVRPVLLTADANTAYVFADATDLADYYTSVQADVLLNGKVAKIDKATYTDYQAASPDKWVDSELLITTLSEVYDYFIGQSDSTPTNAYKIDRAALKYIYKINTVNTVNGFTLTVPDTLISTGAQIRVMIRNSTPGSQISVLEELNNLTTQSLIPHIRASGGLVMESAGLYAFTLSYVNGQRNNPIPANSTFVISKLEKFNGATPGGGTGVTDGDKGDIIVSATGAVWKLDQKSATSGQVLQWNGTEWVPANVAAGTGVTDGDKGDIVVSATGTAWTLKAASVLALTLNGLGSLTGTITSADSIIQAFSRIKGFIDGIATTIRGTVLTGLDTNLAGTAAPTDSILQAVGKLQRQATANNTLAKEFTINVDFAGLATSTSLVFNQKFTITAAAISARIATISYKVGAAATRTLIADVNTDIAATSGTFELLITVTFTSGQNAGVVSIPCRYV